MKGAIDTALTGFDPQVAIFQRFLRAEQQLRDRARAEREARTPVIAHEAPTAFDPFDERNQAFLRRQAG